jgi:hypothetical protein
MNPNNYITWKKFISIAKSKCDLTFYDDKCHPLHYGLSLNGKLPFSVNEYEFNYMKDFIIKHNLQLGYELATGIGVSTVGIGLGFKQTDGMLLTLDSYIEEKNQNIVDNKYDFNMVVNSKGYNNNKKLLQAFEVDKNVVLKQGWSPVDSIKYLNSYFNDKKLDFVFLDCPKFIDEYDRDVKYLKDYINKEKFAIFVHDTHCMRNDYIVLSEKYFDITPIFINTYMINNTEIKVEFPISLITNIQGY